ncbi:MAG TPA: putative hydro-lyase [Planctomycetia bacterium]|nr:putative hydro-lyase [Planctomycetia bacterium]
MDRTPAREFRARCRADDFHGPTAGQALGFAQANLVILPQDWAFDFLLFCQRNPKPCPLLDVTEPGDPEPRGVAPGADLRTDLPLYRVFRDGVMTEEVPDLRALWRNDFVAFLLGCSFTFEAALLRAGLGVRHLDEPNSSGKAKNVPMYRTNRPCRPAGRFRGPLVVSMRPYRPGDAVKAAAITARYPQVHGAPVHFGDPGSLGVRDLSRPDYGDPVSLGPGEVPVFWACGVTPQAAILEAKPPIAIAHAPGHMFVCDVTDDELAG